MLLIRKTVSAVLILSVILTAASCSNETGRDIGGPDDIGDPEYETSYYSTRMITIPQNAFVLKSFYNGEYVCFISGTTDGDGEEFHYTNTMYVYDLEGKKVSENVIPDCDLRISDACSIGNGRYVVLGANAAEAQKCRIYDDSGALLRSIDLDLPAFWHGSVCKADDGFILCATGRICRCDMDGNIIDEIDIEVDREGNSDISPDTVFEQKGHYYCSGADQFYEIDLESGTVEPLFTSGDVGLEFWPEFYFASDYHRGTYGAMLGKDRYVTGLNMAEQRTEILADISNMLICPSTYESPYSESEYLHVLDKDLFFIPYKYPSRESSVTEIALIVPDDSLNLASLYDCEIGALQDYYDMRSEFGAEPVYVGYPSINGSGHILVPVSMVAVSSSTEHADACLDLIRILMSGDIQRRVCAAGYIPADNGTLLEEIDVLKDPDNAPQDLKAIYSPQFIYDNLRDGRGRQIVPLTDELADEYLEQISAADTVMAYDWGLCLITHDEVSAYYTQGKSIEEIADALYSRYLVYAQENY